MENEITKDNGRTVFNWASMCRVLKYLLNYWEIEMKSKDDSNKDNNRVLQPKSLGSNIVQGVQTFTF